jgi:hypothetical protein
LAVADARTSNGNGNGNAESPPRLVFTQLSTSGTPRDSTGLTQPDEYVWELLDRTRRMEFFEEMGNDGAIATALQARSQEVYAANWQLRSEDDSDKGTEILDFVQTELDDHIEELLRWLTVGPLQYGFVGIEPVFENKDTPFGRLIGIAKLAHIRQVTIEIHITDNGDLDFLMQRVWDGITQIERRIPADKVLWRTYDREGADYYGKPPLRRLWREYRFKTQIEKGILQHFDKFGAGILKWVEPKEGLTTTDRQRLMDYGAAIRMGATNVFSVPNGVTSELITADGSLSSAALNWKQEYESRIAKVLLTQGTDLGTTDTGSRAVGQTFEEQLAGAVQADAENIAAIILEKLIKPLVRYNYGEQEHYPEYAPSQRAKIRSGFTDELTKAKAAGIFHATPADEYQFRDRFELPEIPLDELQKNADEAKLQAAAVAAAPPGSPASSAAGQGDRPPAPQGPQRVAASRAAALRQLAYDVAAGGPVPAVKGEWSHRTVEFSEWEQRILQPDLLTRQLDLESQRTTAETHDVLRQIDDYLATQAEKIVVGGPAALGAFNPRVSPRLRQALIDALQSAAERVKELGDNAVRREIRLQLGPEGVGPQRAPSGFGLFVRALRTIVLAQPEDAKSIHLAAEVKRAAEEEIDRREQSTRGAIAIALSQAAGNAELLASVLSTALRSALDSLSPNRTADNIQRVVNTSFGIGRSEAAQAINDAASGGGGRGGARSGITYPDGSPVELVSKIYSAVMDMGTCDECAKWDGAHFPIDYPEDITGVQAPNPRCAGGARCRCAWIYVTDKEVPANVGPTKGPNA